MIKFKKTSSTAPIFVYFTVHFDDDGGDLNTYPKDFKNQVYIVAYGIVGLTDHVDPEVYDAHEAFEIDKTKMKMLVPLDMNGKQLMNVNLDLKFGNLFKIIKCYAKFNSGRNYGLLYTKSNNSLFTTSNPIVTHSFNLYRYRNFGKNPFILFRKPRTKTAIRKNIYPIPIVPPSLTNANEYCFDIPIMCVFTTGIYGITLHDVGNTQFDVDVILSLI